MNPVISLDNCLILGLCLYGLYVRLDKLAFEPRFQRVVTVIAKYGEKVARVAENKRLSVIARAFFPTTV